MKTKTLAALALIAALGASPAWAAEVVSSNIVGYQKVELQPGFNFVAPQFTAVGGGPIDLQSIKLDVADEDATGADSISVLDADGNPIATYAWFPADWFGGEKSGWVDGETGGLAEVNLDNGLSVLLDSALETDVTVCGEVKNTDSTLSSQTGFNFVGNSSPIAIDIQDIQIDVTDDEATGGDSISVLDADGNPVATYAWFPAEWFGGEKSGWVDGETGGLAEVQLQPGQGVLLDAASDGMIISIPSAIQ